MGFLEKPKLSEPNELGYQFGINESLTKYAHDKQMQSANTYLPGVKITVMEVWKDDKLVAYLLVDEKTNQPLKEAQGYEAAAVDIDAYKILAQSKQLEKN